MNYHILTLFPEMVTQGLSESILGRAAKKGLLSVNAVNIRDYTADRHKKVDDYPYGGGAGMLMQAQPVYDAWKAACEEIRSQQPEELRDRPVRTVYVTPQGAVFNQQMAKEFAKEEDLIFLCGHYEGIDERVLEETVTDYVSIGDYVLTGGELPAMVMIDAISRMVPGVLANGESGETESFEGDLLEYPQYSRPEEWHGKQVPKVLLSGNQRKIAEWRRQEAERRTQERRPDLYAGYERLMSCKKVLAGDKLLHVDMTELIARGQARLVFAEGKNICLQDKVSGAYFHTAEDIKAGCRMLEILQEDAGEGSGLLVLHQEFMTEPAEKYLRFRTAMTCNQIVYTKREKLPVTGLYRMDGKPAENGVVIRPLTMEHLDAVVRDYNTISDEAYVTDRIKKGALFGAFVDGQLAGFIGMHAEGGIGMLFVSPEYRRRRIGMALETYMINLGLERGERPYGQVEIGNDASKGLQEALGLCFSKGRIYWMEREERE